MPKFTVWVGKEVAFNAEVEVEAASAEEAEDIALEMDIPAEKWEEGDWESARHVQDVLEPEGYEEEGDDDA
jgi:hypothetical protein